MGRPTISQWQSDIINWTHRRSIDMSTAFDTVDHHILLKILKRGFCITDSALAWFNSLIKPNSNSSHHKLHLRCRQSQLWHATRVILGPKSVHCLHRGRRQCFLGAPLGTPRLRWRHTGSQAHNAISSQYNVICDILFDGAATSEIGLQRPALTNVDRLHWLSCYIFTRESSCCFHRVLAVAILSVRPSVCLSFHLSVRPSHGWNEIGPRLDLGATLLSLCDLDR